MIREAIARLEGSEEYKAFIRGHPSYYLAHCFAMVQEKNPAYKWEIGYYSPDEDMLAIFETEPIKLREQEEVFKESGVVRKLDMGDVKTDFDTAMVACNQLLKEKYSRELVMNRIVILQNTGQAIYNVTLVTMAMNMVNIKVDASTGAVVSSTLQSIMSLKKQ